MDHYRAVAEVGLGAGGCGDEEVKVAIFGGGGVSEGSLEGEMFGGGRMLVDLRRLIFGRLEGQRVLVVK